MKKFVFLLSAVLSLGLVFAQDTGGATGGAAGSETLQVVTSGVYGDYLTDSSGRAVYLFEGESEEGETGETGGEETGDDAAGGVRAEAAPCTGDCLQAWPPVLASEPIAGDGVDASLLGTTTREDGSVQVTYNGWPLYYFVRDAGPGDTNGQEVESFGGEWYLVSPEGTEVEAEGGTTGGEDADESTTGGEDMTGGTGGTGGQ